MSTDYDLPSGVSLSDLQTLAEQLIEGSEPSPLPLSSAQLRLWFLDQLEPNSPRYNIPSVVWLAGPLETEKLEEALKAIVSRHEILRARFIDQQGEPAQVIGPEEEFQLGQHDLRPVPAAERDATAQRLIEQEVRGPFDLSVGPLLRTTLLQLSDTEHILIVNMHHIISDEWSFQLFYRELQEIYTALVLGVTPELPELPIQYGDYAAWQQDWMQSDEFKRQLQFWQNQLAGNPPAVKLPLDRPRRFNSGTKGASRIGHLSPEIQESLHRLAMRQKATPFMLLLAGFKALLHRMTGQEDIIVGSPMACRHHAETENVIGLFANTLPLRTRVSGALTFEQLLAAVREGVVGAFCHQDMPFEKLVETLQPERVAGQTPFISILYLYQNDADFPELPGLRLTFLDLGTETAKFDITVFVAEVDEGLVLGMEYNAELFEAKTIAEFLDQYEQLLCAVVANPGQRISDITLRQSRQPAATPLGWTPPDTPAPRWQFLDRWFELRRERRIAEPRNATATEVVNGAAR
ncbi:MAG TPA: condensation domain-containing protein [Verrucomicrobiae bacterium]|nr:condensation domain-containing protein [Verrucomicrobiae bacterium]